MTTTSTEPNTPAYAAYFGELRVRLGLTDVQVLTLSPRSDGTAALLVGGEYLCELDEMDGVSSDPETAHQQAYTDLREGSWDGVLAGIALRLADATQPLLTQLKAKHPDLGTGLGKCCQVDDWYNMAQAHLDGWFAPISTSRSIQKCGNWGLRLVRLGEDAEPVEQTRAYCRQHGGVARCIAEHLSAKAERREG